MAGRTAGCLPVSRTVRPGVRQLPETVRPCPASVLTRTSDLLAPNPEALIMFGGLAELPAERRNTIRHTVLHQAARELFADWEHAAETTAARLRSLASYPDDPDVPRTDRRAAQWKRGVRPAMAAARRTAATGEAKPFRHL